MLSWMASRRRFCGIFSLSLVLWVLTLHWPLVQAVIVLPDSDKLNSKAALLVSRDDIPNSPPWVYPSEVQDPPLCIIDGEYCGWKADSIANCSAEKCVETFVGSCMNTATLVDKDCICASLSSSLCRDQCISIKWGTYLYWLNDTCGDLDDWHGLFDGWVQEADKAVHADLLQVGTRSEVIAGVDIYAEYVDGYTDNYFPPYQIPQIINDTCPSIWHGRWNSSLYNLTQIQLVQGTDTGYDDLDTEEALYLDRLSFCLNTYTTLPSGCDVGIRRSETLLWMAQICKEPTQYGWPLDWQNAIIALNSTYLEQRILNETRPSCTASQPECQESLYQHEIDCSTIRCKLDSAGNCSSLTTAVDRPCYCKNIKYGTTCHQTCQLSWERERLLDFMNSTCESVVGWNGLPDNWKSLRLVQEWELMPWSWQIRSNEAQALHRNGTFESSQSTECPSATAKLTAFGVANLAMALLTPLIGRRDVMKKLTCGSCGKPGSRMWLLVGPLTVVLHITSNAVGALLIRSTPGYEDIDVGKLILLWCTRPRMAWMVIALIPWQAKDSIYFSVAGSSILSEAILQIIGSVYVGTATSYAGRQKFYQLNRLIHVPRGRDALLMYSGTLLWLILFVFAVLTCVWTLFDINNHTKRLVQKAARAGRGATKRAKSGFDSATRQITAYQTMEAEFQKGRLNSGKSLCEYNADEERISAGFQALREAWGDLAERWNSLHKYLTQDVKAIAAAERNLKKNKKLLAKAKSKGHPYVAENRQVVDAELLVEYLKSSRSSKPEAWLAELQNRCELALAELQKRRALFVAGRRAPSDLDNNTDASLNTVLFEFLGRWDHDYEGRLINTQQTLLYQKKLKDAEFSFFEEKNLAIMLGLDDFLLSAKSLRFELESQSSQRLEERARALVEPADKLKQVAAKGMLGMIGCWAAQWMWWAGYVQVAGDSYCPPRLKEITVIWVAFSAFGAVFGATW